MRRFVRRVDRAVRVYGITGASRRAWGALRSSGDGGPDPFDDEMGVATAGIVRLESLSVPAEARRNGHRYQPSDPAVLRRTIEALPIRYEDFAFVDVGSGKGRALLVASEYPFGRIVGIEFAPELHEVAQRNIAAYANPAQRCTAIDAVCADATAYELPAEPLVLYFYNPFLEPVMQRVMANITASLEADPRPALVVLSRDTPLGSTVEAAGFARRDDLAADDQIFALGV